MKDKEEDIEVLEANEAKLKAKVSKYKEQMETLQETIKEHQAGKIKSIFFCFVLIFLYCVNMFLQLKCIAIIYTFAIFKMVPILIEHPIY